MARASVSKSLFFAIAYVRLTWAQELCIFMIVWMAKFGAAYGVRTGIHVGVDILVETPQRQRAARCSSWPGCSQARSSRPSSAPSARNLVWHIYDTGQTSAVLELPMWLVYLAVPLGSYLMCFRFLEVAWHFWKTGERPHHDPGNVEGIDTPPRGGGRRGDGSLHLPAARRASARRHAGLHRARPDGAHGPVHADRRSARVPWR